MKLIIPIIVNGLGTMAIIMLAPNIVIAVLVPVLSYAAGLFYAYKSLK